MNLFQKKVTREHIFLRSYLKLHLFSALGTKVKSQNQDQIRKFYIALLISSEYVEGDNYSGCLVPTYDI